MFWAPQLPVSASSQFFYSPMYRRYFGLTPPNPRLCNPRLLEDYVDWYMNVYLEEELPWHSVISQIENVNIHHVNMFVFFFVDQHWHCCRKSQTKWRRSSRRSQKIRCFCFANVIAQEIVDQIIVRIKQLITGKTLCPCCFSLVICILFYFILFFVE
jgi:hypothetical protein